jgi:hypothetical protein
MNARKLFSLVAPCSTLALLAACGSSNNSSPPAETPDSSTEMDSSTTPDSSVVPDSGSATDSGADAGLPADGGGSTDAGDSGGGSTDAGDSGGGSTDAGDSGTKAAQVMITTVDTGVVSAKSVINQGTAIGEGKLNGATPATLTNLAADTNNSDTIVSSTNPFKSTGHVPDTAAGFCVYPDAGPPTRVSYVTGSKFETAGADGGGTDQMVPMAPFYFPLVYTTTNTTADNAFGGQPPIIGLFDWRPKDIDEGLVAAESDDYGKTWYFMQLVLELNPDYTNAISGGSGTSTATGCPPTIGDTNANYTSANGSQADDGWGHAAIIQLPGLDAAHGQFLYMLDRNTNNLPDAGVSIVDNAPLHAINITGSTNKFPIWNTNNTNPGNNDIKSISSALENSTGTAGTANAVTVQDTVGLLNPDGIMAVFPTTDDADAGAGSPVTVMYVQKILNGDTSWAAAQKCTAAPVSGKVNDDVSNVRLATTTDGIHFTDLGIVEGLNDPTTVDYNKTRWISPRGTLIDIKGDGSVWGLYFAGGNCLDGDSDAFHYIGYAESTDKMHWTVFNDINSPIASINTITHANQAGGASVTIPANAPVIPTEPWFAQRLYAPTAVRIDATHLGMTFAGYGVQTPNNDLLNYRQIGNVVLTVNQQLPATTPNNINTH